MVDTKGALETIGGEGLLGPALHTGVANQRVERWQLPRLQAVADLTRQIPAPMPAKPDRGAQLPLGHQSHWLRATSRKRSTAAWARAGSRHAKMTFQGLVPETSPNKAWAQA